MEFERIRLSTFASYPRDATVSALELAQDGFIYIGTGKVIKCYFCGWSTARFNVSFNDIVRDHAMLSPTCPLVNGKARVNVKWSADPETRIQEILRRNNYKPLIYKANRKGNAHNGSTQNRHKQNNTFTQRPIFFANTSLGNRYVSTYNKRTHSQATSTSLEDQPSQNGASNSAAEIGNQITSEDTRGQAKAGRSEEPQTATTSIHTISQTESTTSIQHPETTNQTFMAPSVPPEVPAPQSSPTILNTNNQAQSAGASSSSGESRQGPSYSDLGIITEMPKRPEYALKSKRLETFLSWPRDHHLTPEELSEAGFYYAGYGDCARCFYCGGGLRNWEDEDDVWVEHARWFPKCAFIRGKLGNNFIDIVLDLSKQFEQISLQTVIDKLGHPLLLDNHETNIKKDPAVRSVVDLGYRENDVVEVTALLKDQSIPISADVILEKLKQELKHKSGITRQRETITNSPVNGEAMIELKERNNQLRQQIVCKICLDKDVSVVFLPCGHLVSCTDCSIAMRDCPVCRTHIKGTVRAFMN